jgi:hypothetical protein
MAENTGIQRAIETANFAIEKIAKEMQRQKQRRLSFLFGKLAKELQRQKRRRLGFLFGRNEIPLRKSRVPEFTPVPEDVLRRRYLASPAAKKPDAFVLYRVIGNDLPPRHAPGQTRSNLIFILEHESQFPDCEKRWVVNRIHDPEEEGAILNTLQTYDQKYLRIPFDPAEYRKTEWDMDGLPSRDFVYTNMFVELDDETRNRVETYIRRHKNIYAINNNGARNAALGEGRQRAKWVLPFDGNCFFTPEGFADLRNAIQTKPWYPYFIVPMMRAGENFELNALRPNDAALAEEPQIAFRYDAGESFDEAIPYGRRPKVELLWRLGVPGSWDRYLFDPWDPQRPTPANEAGQVQNAGWVIRLQSGRPEQEIAGRAGLKGRGFNRNEAIVARLDRLDGEVLVTKPDSKSLVYYDAGKIAALERHGDLAAELRSMAESALLRGPYSVVDKTEVAPSGDKHDYWHPSPYWWPNPNTEDGFPFIRRDGKRISGTSLYEKGSERFDRTRLQRLFDDVTILSLASSALNEKRYGRHAAGLIKHWFLDANSRMNPHLKYAQVVPGREGGSPRGAGIIEFKDVFYFLDGARLLARDKYLTRKEIARLKEWFSEYVEWLETSPQGLREAHSVNNHGTFYDLQLGAIAAFLGDPRLSGLTVNRGRQRISVQFEKDGSQPRELERTRPRHYVCFNLAGWVLLSNLLAAFGQDIVVYKDQDGRSLADAFAWLARADNDRLWPRADLTPFDPVRKEPLWAFCRSRNLIVSGIPTHPPGQVPPILHPDYAVPPFWMLAK